MKKLIFNYLICAILALALPGIAAARQNQPDAGFPRYYGSSAQQYLKRAKQAGASEKQIYYLYAAGRYLQERNPQPAKELLNAISEANLPQELVADKTLLRSNLALQTNQTQAASSFLDEINEPNQLSQHQRVAYYELQARIQDKLGNSLLGAEARMSLDPLLESGNSRQFNRQAIWQELNHLSLRDLATQIHSLPYGQLQGWLEIVYNFKQYADDQKLLDHELAIWQQRYPQHPANTLLPNYQSHTEVQVKKNQKYTTHKVVDSAPVISPIDDGMHVAILLPTSGKLTARSEAIRQGFMAAHFQHQKDPKAPKSINVYDTAGKDVVEVYRQAVKDGNNFVVGPLTKTNVQAMQKYQRLPVKTLALNYGKSDGMAENLYEFALSPKNEAQQAAVIAKNQGFQRALVIAPSGAWGESIAQTFKDIWQQTDGDVSDILLYDNKTDLNQAIKEILHVDKSIERKNEIARITRHKIFTTPKARQDIDFIFLVATPMDARQVRPLLKFYYAGNVPIYATSMIYSGQPNPLQDKDLDGIQFCDIPWNIAPNPQVAKAQEQMQQLIPGADAEFGKLFAFGLDAYSLVQYLATGSGDVVGLHGMTGTLFLDQQHRIFRQLPWAIFKHGQPIQAHLQG